MEFKFWITHVHQEVIYRYIKKSKFFFYFRLQFSIYFIFYILFYFLFYFISLLSLKNSKYSLSYYNIANQIALKESISSDDSLKIFF